MIHNLIWLLHFILVTVIFSSIFLYGKSRIVSNIKNISFAFLIYLLLQYATGYSKCGLTEFEYYIKGEKYQEGFLYRLIKPVINKPEKYFYRKLFIFHIIWIIILGYQINIISDIHKYFV